MKKLLILWLFLTFFYYVQRNDKPKEELETFESTKSPKADSTREVHHFDWDNNKFVYVDELPKPKKRIKYRENNGGYIPLDYYPDYTVQIIEGSYRQPSVDYMIIDNKRYRIRTLSNGTQTLTPSR